MDKLTAYYYATLRQWFALRLTQDKYLINLSGLAIVVLLFSGAYRTAWFNAAIILFVLVLIMEIQMFKISSDYLSCEIQIENDNRTDAEGVLLDAKETRASKALKLYDALIMLCFMTGMIIATKCILFP